jgi:hypothetical protein
MLQNARPKTIQGFVLDPTNSNILQDELNPALLRTRPGARHLCCRNDRRKPIQGFVLDPASSHALQDESCAPTHATRSAAFMLQERPTEADPGIRPRSNQLEHSAG